MKWAGLIAVLLVHGALVLGGVYLMLLSFGDELDRELDSQVERVERDFERDLERIRRDIREELDMRLPPPVVTP